MLGLVLGRRMVDHFTVHDAGLSVRTSLANPLAGRFSFVVLYGQEFSPSP